jgi:hypothetical protein
VLQEPGGKEKGDSLKEKNHSFQAYKITMKVSPSEVSWAQDIV